MYPMLCNKIPFHFKSRIDLSKKLLSPSQQIYNIYIILALFIILILGVNHMSSNHTITIYAMLKTFIPLIKQILHYLLIYQSMNLLYTTSEYFVTFKISLLLAHKFPSRLFQIRNNVNFYWMLFDMYVRLNTRKNFIACNK